MASFVHPHAEFGKEPVAPFLITDIYITTINIFMNIDAVV